MKNNLSDIKPAPLLTEGKRLLKKVQPYSLLVFILFVGLIYAFVLLRIQHFTTEQPSETAIDSQVQAAHIPHINPSVVQQLQSLQDNSVNVQALFNQARSNPFQ